MRNIETLLKTHGRVWFSVGEEYRAQFAAEIESLGIKFANGQTLSAPACGPYMGVRKTGEVAYITGMIWHYSFHATRPTGVMEKHALWPMTIRVDYGKYITGAGDYLIDRAANRVSSSEHGQ